MYDRAPVIFRFSLSKVKVKDSNAREVTLSVSLFRPVL